MQQVALTREDVERILEGLPRARVGFLGDVCLDMYWHADMTRSRLSRETPHFPLPVVREEASPGAGGNVLSNLAALEPARVMPVSVVGDDWRGMLLHDCLTAQGIDTDGLLSFSGRITPGYCKPLRMGYAGSVQEDPRLDFENAEPLTPDQEQAVLDALTRVASQVDVLAVSDQFDFGVLTPRIRQVLSKLGQQGLPVVVDSRSYVGAYRQVIIKPNELEAALAAGMEDGAGALRLEDYEPIAGQLFRKTGRPVVVTLGDTGALWHDGQETHYAPAREAPPPVDIVGAGDTFMAAFCAALAVGTAGAQAIAFANLASGVTVRKLRTTGTATPKEIRALLEEEI